jgi:catechol 2,3-dioxygenase-like lactoylglutathione lyase family enzyme
MEVQGIYWLGIRTEKFDDMLRLFRDLMGLVEVSSEDGFAALRARDGDMVELFRPQSSFNQHFGTAPVAGFTVTDFAAALSELQAAGIEFADVESHPGGRSWAHFRAPDGNLYEITGP